MEHKQHIFPQGKQSKTWKTSLNLPGFKENEVMIKVDHTQHALNITAKHRTEPSCQGNTTMVSIAQNKVKCMLPVPHNVEMNTLRVRMDCKAGQLLVKGPFQYNELWQRNASTFSVKPCSLKETFSTNVVKDEESGKWKMILHINAMNFQRDNIQVNYQEEQKVLVVEMRLDSTTAASTPQKQTLCVLKMVREEIALLEEVNAKELDFKVENGLLSIELPLLREPSNKSNNPQTDNQENNEDKQDKQTKLSKKMRQNKQGCEENKDWIHAVWPF
jgi:HSP20 family molecular chaperone IbpA